MSTYRDDLTCRIYGWHHEKMADRPYRPDDEVGVTVGSMVMGYRFKDLSLSPVARERINEAAKIIAWCRHLACRFENPPEELMELIDV